MRRLFFLFACLSLVSLHAQQGNGGYFGHRFIVQGDMSYAPTYKNAAGFFYRWDFQYGGSVHLVTNRYRQVGLTWNMWSLSQLQNYNADYSKADRIKGMDYGLNIRNFRKKRGGIAPIGKFWDINLTCSSAKLFASSSNSFVQQGNEALLPKTTSQVSAHIAFGTQGLFWNRVIANTGLRFGAPIATLDETGATLGSHIIRNRMASKEYFSVFFGVGILL